MGRAPCCDKANVKKGPWSPEEDAKLKAYMEKYGTGGNWIALPQKIGLKRCGKSCRLRWLNYLRPNIKHGGFTEEEDNIICSLYISIGSRWSIIAAQLPGRTDNDIKNYWNTRLKKKLLGRRKQSSTGFINNPLRDTRNEVEESNNINVLSNSALERLQLHMQLQGLQNQNNQNPFSSFYLWPTTPKLHPPMMNTGNNNNHNENPTDDSQKDDEQLFYKPTVPSSSLHQQEHEKINTCPSSSSQLPFIDPMENHQQVSALQAELHEIILSNNSKNNMPIIQDHQDQMADFDCFAEMNSIDSKDNNLMNMWWSSSNDLRASSSSWGSSTSTGTTAPVVLQPEGMFQDNYELVVAAYSL